MKCLWGLAALGALLLPTSFVQADLISEFESNPPGTDPATVSIELSGAANTSFSGWLLSIEGDVTSTSGDIQSAAEVSGTYDSNGLAVVNIADLENPSFTFVFSSMFNGAVDDTDLDVDNDGVIDVDFDIASVFGEIYDAIGITDSSSESEPLYGAQLGGIDFAYTGDEPELLFRDGSVGDWYAVNVVDANDGEFVVYGADGSELDPSLFSADPRLSTFGSFNPTAAAVPEPGSFGLAGLAMFGGAAMVWRRRRAAKKAA